MSLVQNEKTKLSATAISNVGLALIIAGVVAPLVASSFGGAGAPPANALTIAISVVWLIVGVALHISGRQLLQRLRP